MQHPNRIENFIGWVSCSISAIIIPQLIPRNISNLLDRPISYINEKMDNYIDNSSFENKENVKIYFKITTIATAILISSALAYTSFHSTLYCLGRIPNFSLFFISKQHWISPSIPMMVAYSLLSALIYKFNELPNAENISNISPNNIFRFFPKEDGSLEIFPELELKFPSTNVDDYAIEKSDDIFLEKIEKNKVKKRTKEKTIHKEQLEKKIYETAKKKADHLKIKNNFIKEQLKNSPKSFINSESFTENQEVVLNSSTQPPNTNLKSSEKTKLISLISNDIRKDIPPKPKEFLENFYESHKIVSQQIEKNSLIQKGLEKSFSNAPKSIQEAIENLRLAFSSSPKLSIMTRAIQNKNKILEECKEELLHKKKDLAFEQFFHEVNIKMVSLIFWRIFYSKNPTLFSLFVYSIANCCFLIAQRKIFGSYDPKIEIEDPFDEMNAWDGSFIQKTLTTTSQEAL